MISPKAWHSATDQTSFRKVDAVQATAADDPVETWNDISGNGRHAVSAGNSAAASSATTRGALGAQETLGSFTGKPLRMGNGVQTNRYITPANSFSMPASALGDLIATFSRIRPPATALARTLIGNSSGGFNSNLLISTTAAAGQVAAATAAGAIKTDTTTRLEILTQIKQVSAGNVYVGRLNGSETVGGNGAGATVPATSRLSIGNVYGGSQGADVDLFEVLILPQGTSRANMQRLEGWIAHTYGQAALLPVDHPYKVAAPTVPAGTTSTADWTDANFTPTMAQQTWLGPQAELQADSFDSSATTTNIENQTDIWGFPYSLTAPEQARLKSEWFPGNGTGYMFLRFPLGFAYRGLRNIDGASGLAKNIGERFAGQNASIANMLANVSAVGGGLYPEYWSPPPHWKTNSSYGSRGGGTNGRLWAGGGYARSITLDSIRVSDPTQYAAQMNAIAVAMVDDLEYLHANVAPVRGFSLQNESTNNAEVAYGHCIYTDQLYADLFVVVAGKIAASSALATHGGQANTVNLFGRSWTVATASSPFEVSSIYPSVKAYTIHYITDLYTDGDHAKSNMTGWLNSTGQKAVADNEFEYFVDPGNDPWQFANTALVQAHFMALGRAPTHNPMIHVLKQLGQTGQAGNTKGYAVLKARLPAPFNQAPSTPGDAEPTLAHGHYEAQGLNSNAVKAFSDNVAPGSVMYPNFYTQSVAGTQTVSFVTPGGKRSHLVVNRTAGALTVKLGFGRAGVKIGKRYSMSEAGTVIPSVNASGVTLAVPAYSVEVWSEQ